MLRLTLFATILAMSTVGVSAQQSLEMPLWQGTPEYVTDAADTAKLYVYLPKADKATGRAVIICPGGGYAHLSMGHEGKDWAPFFTRQGIAAIVLKYRMPNGDWRVPVGDAEEAVRLVRRHAAEWNIDPSQVGIMGFSAGGHLASTVATQSESDARPDFQILFYPVITMMPDITHQGSHDNFLGEKPKKKMEQQFSNDTQVSRLTPRAFIVLSDDDRAVLPANGASYYMELYRHDVPATLHIYPDGGHGYGYREEFPYHLEMLLELKAWLSTF